MTASGARIGALMEAVESDHAERVGLPTRFSPFAALPRGERAPRLSDFASGEDADMVDDDPIAWVAGQRLVGGRTLWIPLDVVSLDFTRRGDVRLDRSSNGLGAHFQPAAASAKALLEVIERDAMAQWRALPFVARSLTRLDLTSIPFPWFQTLRLALGTAGLILAAHGLTSVIGAPAFYCELAEPAASEGLSQSVYGSACDFNAEAALRGAILEAIQSRLTAISGARDDIPGCARGEIAGPALGSTLPLPPGLAGRTWEGRGHRDISPRLRTPEGLAQTLALAGYPDAALIDLSRSGGDVTVVKAFVPGLAAFWRPRRLARVCHGH